MKIISKRKFEKLLETEGGMILENASEKIQDDRRLVYLSVGYNGMALKFASENRKKDIDVVLHAVRQNGLALHYAVDKFKGDKLIVLEAVKQNGWAFQFASKEMQHDKVVVSAAVGNYYPLGKVPVEFREDAEVALIAISADFENLKDIDHKLLDNKDFCIKLSDALKKGINKFLEVNKDDPKLESGIKIIIDCIDEVYLSKKEKLDAELEKEGKEKSDKEYDALIDDLKQTYLKEEKEV